MQTSSVMWDTIVYNTSFFLFASFSSASCRISLLSFCISPQGAEGLSGLCGVGLLGVWEMGAVHGPSVFDPVLKAEKVGEHPFSSSPSPFLSFSCLLPKKGLDVRY